MHPSAFDLDFDVDFAFHSDREGHGFSRAARLPLNQPGFSR
jgi:hypothetical protein